MNKFNPGAYLSGLNIDVMHFGLEAIGELLTRFGNPQDSFPTVLIGGTNGKGSTAAMAAAIGVQAGYRVGLYTSPHLQDVRERIVINGLKITPQKFSRILSEIKYQTTAPLTYFEALTAAALIYFAREQVDIALLEVGLGGRLDATNVCRPLVSVITNIGLEHTAYLGNTLTAIAGEKAGIIKPAGVCITGATQKKVVETIAAVCREKKAALYRLGTDFRMTKRANGLADYRGIGRQIKGLELSLPGGHQAANAALALASLEIAAGSGFAVDDASIRSGLKNTRWEARMEILCTDPLFLLDGAHNPSGMTVLRRALEKDFSWKRLILIFAALADKDYRRMLQIIAPLASRIILPPLSTARAVPPEQMASAVKDLGCLPTVAQSVDQAIRRALDMAGPGDMVCALGSLYLAGEVKQAFHQIRSCGKA
ncbi:MAG: bifunctional folylpolyglutamate synthase/dihydrofolate synthase [Deltaproteobacteria bacterium]|nr:bifunctional folylpolyglutamate synthase/dihydrofolate synthase [Deltaproteobacteria bacterium]